MVLLKKRKERAPVDLTEAPILPNLIKFCIPLMLTGMLQLLYNSADLIVVGQFSSPTAVGAVGACGPLINLLINLFIGLSVGVSVNVAQYIGAKRGEDVRDVVHTSMALALVLGVVVGAAGFFIVEDALIWMKTPETTLAEAVPYARAYMTGIPAVMVYNYCAAILRAKGDTTRPLIFLSISGAVNVVLNLWTVISFHMGALGVGIATSVSQYVAMILILIYMTFSLKDECRIEWSKVRFHKDKLIKILKVGLPAGLQSVVFSISNVLIQSSVNTFGDAVIDGNAAASNLDGFIYNAQNSVYQAAITFVGQHIGARRYERLNRVIFSCMGLVTVIGLSVGMVEILFARPLLKIYVPGEEAAIAWGEERLIIMGVTYFLCGLMDVGCGCLRGMGKTFLPMITSLIGSCALRILWIYTVFQVEHTMLCLYISYPVSWLVTGAAELSFAFCLKKKLQEQDRIQMLLN